MGRRSVAHSASARRRQSGDGQRDSSPVSLTSIACGFVVVALVVVPALFNPRGQNAFGVVKAGLVQLLGVLAGLTAAGALWSERRRPRTGPLLLACGCVVASYVMATATGVAPALSFFAPGVRHEGTFALLALAAVAFAVSTFDAVQLGTIAMAAIVGSIGPCVYAIAQALASLGDTANTEGIPRVGGSFGNPILFAGYLVTVMPITAAMVLGALQVPESSDDAPRTAGLRSSGCWIVLGLQLAALLLTRARGAWIATLVAATVFGLVCLDLTRAKRQAVTVVFLVLLVTAGIGGALVMRQSIGTLPVGPTVQVRLMIWDDVVRLIRASPSRMALGYGPEMLQAVVAPFYSPELLRFEGTFSVPDRSHNDLLDTIVGVGAVGATAVVGLHVLLWAQLLALVRGDAEIGIRWRDVLWPLSGGAAAGGLALASGRPVWAVPLTAAGLIAGALTALAIVRLKSTPGWTPARWLALGLLAGSLAHFVDIQTGVDTVSSRLVWWCGIGLAVAWAKNIRATESTLDRSWGTSPKITILAGAAAVAGVVFDCWEPGTGLNGASAVIALLTGLVVVMLAAAARPQPRTQWRCPIEAASIVLTMVTGLAVWTTVQPASVAHSTLVDASEWMSYQATACLTFFVLVSCVIGYEMDTRRASPPGRRWLMACGMVAVTAVFLVMMNARPARADLLARIAEQLGALGRWADATAIEDARTRLTPESDLAWAALGGAQLQMAQNAAPADRAERFRLALGALAEARRRNPFEWLHIRNQASTERVWAAADRERRAVHLAEADHLFRVASLLAPTVPRLWSEWGNVDAERGDLGGAFAKLERASEMNGGRDAMVVANAIFIATGVDVGSPEGRARASADLTGKGFVSLARLYADAPPRKQ